MPKDAAPEVMPELGAQRLFSLHGKIALVTGGGTGIGKMIAATYIRNGAKVYIASRKLGDLQKVAEQLSKLAPSDPEGKKGLCVALQADVGSKAGCDALADQVKKAESRLDILVNNSGLTWGAPMVDFPEDKGWNKVFDLNVKSQFYLTVALLPLLEKGKSNLEHATVLNIASTAAIVPLAEGGLSAPGNGTYSYQPSKAASLHLTKVLANSLAEKFIMVNAICPGVFPSRMTAYGLEENRDLLEGIQPTGRVGTPEDIGGVAMFFASRAGAHCTGTGIVVDGGQSIQFQPRLPMALARMGCPSGGMAMNLKMDRFKQDSEIDEATKVETADALARSRQFLTSRLLPDLDRANRDHQSLVAQIDEYKKLRETLRSLDTDDSGIKHSNSKDKDAILLADIGGGVAAETQLVHNENPIISLGLANFYAQLTNREARAFITKKLTLLETKRDRAIDKLAKIEAHIHLTSTSITQLDNLHRGGSIIDDV
ncbi:Short chain dehydrogenase/reductase [Pseudozyma hubeiensis]|nr:Short chain dehydrogenase/reductase [Pseudozyma hubeiensis]